MSDVGAALAQLEGRGRTRLPLRTAAFVFLVIVLYAGAACLFGDPPGPRLLSWIFGLTAAAFVVWLIVVRFSGRGGQGPLPGLPYAERRRVMRGLRAATLDGDPLLREVQLLAARRLTKDGPLYWLSVVVAVVFWGLGVQAAQLRAPNWQLQLVTAALYSGVAIYQIVNVRGAKKLLAASV